MFESAEHPVSAEGYKHHWRGGDEPPPAPGEPGADATATAYERFMAAIED